MGFDGLIIPDWAKPYVGWVVGMDWPKGDEDGCFRLADACVTAAHRLVESTAADLPGSAAKLGSDWDGAAHLAFATHVAEVADGQVAGLVRRLIDTAVALNGVGVQIQYAKYMIEVTVWLLIAQLAYLLAAALASGGASLALIPPRVQLARLTVAQIAKQVLRNIAMYAGIVAGMDAGIQLTQMAQGRRDELDGRQLVISALSGGAMGGLMGLLSGGLTRLATPALRAGLTSAEMGTAERLLAAASSSIYGQAAQYAVAGGFTTAGTMLAEGNFSWDMLAKGITSSALGADGQHLSTALPHGSGSSPLPSPYASPSTQPPVPDPSPKPGLNPDPGPSANPAPGPGTGPRADSGPAPSPGSTTGPGPSSGSGRGTSLSHVADLYTALHADPAGPATPTHGPPISPPGAGALPDARPHAPQEQAISPAIVVDRSAMDRGPADRADVDRAGTDRAGTDRGSAEPPHARPSDPASTPAPRHAPERTDAGPSHQPPDRGTGTPPHAPAEHGEAQPPSTLGDVGGSAKPDALTAQVTASEVPGTAPGAGGTRVPFDFERFYNDPRWSVDATKFEQRLGAYYFNHPHSLDAARVALGRLRDVLRTLTPREPGEHPTAFARRVESAFFRDDHTSSGQVGRTGVTVDDLIAHGNVRELVTAVYNGAYFNRYNPHIFGKALLDIMDRHRWVDAHTAGLDVDALRRAHHQLDERMHRLILGRLESRFTGMYTFSRDPFGTGNVGMLSERGALDVAEIIMSQLSRRDRTEAEIQRLGLTTTPGEYERRGAPLGRFERQFLESVLGEPLRPDTPLPWREGVTSHETTSGRWAKKVMREGFPVIDGVSGTTAKMLTAIKFLRLGPVMTERFLGALMAWMLPGQDHSLFEIARGAQIADVGGMRLEPGARPSAADFYRSLPGLDLGTLRQEVLPGGMFPHESRYFDQATDPHGFSETQHPKVRDTAAALWPQLESGKVTDPSLAHWLNRNGIDAADPAQTRALGERLSPAHVMALTVYTRHSHYLINNVTRTQLWTAGASEPVVRRRMVDKVNQLVENYLDNLAAGRKPLPLPLALRPLLHTGDGHLKSSSPLNSVARSYVDAIRRTDEAAQRFADLRAEDRTEEARQAGKDLRDARRVRQAAWNAIKQQVGQATPRLFDEMRWHADMVHDAMAQLPTVGTPERPVQAYRGDWITPVHSPIYGSKWHPHGTAREFLSVSMHLEVAIRFMAENPASDRKVLVVYRLTGQQARDVSIFSSFAQDEEAVFPPHSRTHRVDEPELAASLRAEVDRLAADMAARGVIPEAPRSYEIIVMEEG